MSSLLERMIQRTREPLSAVEPLLQPRYARSETRRSQTDAPAEAIDFASEFSSGEHGPVSRHTAKNLPPQSVDLPGEMQAPVSATPMVYREHRTSSANATNSANDQGIQEAQVVEAAPQQAAPSQRTTRPAQVAIGKAEPNLQVDSENVAFRRIESPASIPNALVSPAIPATRVRVAADKVASPQRSIAEPSMLHPPAIRPQRFAQEHEVRAENKTSDVNITIGHIEVRAAQQSAERPRRPAFRPRVSLSDFLGHGSWERP